jgi:DNA-binding XRE family transcriptional regulator
MTEDKAAVFVKWLDSVLAEYNLTDNQLAIRADISHTNFSKARNKGVLPRWDICLKIARALRIDPVEVFCAAGLLPYPPELDPDFEHLKFSYGKLSERDRKRAVKLVGVLAENED